MQGITGFPTLQTDLSLVSLVCLSLTSVHCLSLHLSLPVFSSIFSFFTHLSVDFFILAHFGSATQISLSLSLSLSFSVYPVLHLPSPPPPPLSLCPVPPSSICSVLFSIYTFICSFIYLSTVRQLNTDQFTKLRIQL